MSVTLEQKLGHDFQKKSLLELALTHRSAARENNERLEFLGDAILGLIVGQQLYTQLPEAKEGHLSRLRADLVQQKPLVDIALEINLGKHLKLGPGEIKSGGASRPSILACGVEALIGAVYLDGGFEACQAVIQRLYGEKLSNISLESLHKDPKTALQEFLQKRHTPLPAYKVLSSTGKAHAMTFRVACHVCNLPTPAVGEGHSHRAAEQQAAQKALKRLHA